MEDKEIDLDEIISQMTLEEKVSMLVGYKNKETLPLDRFGIKRILMSDGSNGLRIENDRGDSLSGITESYKSTCYPATSNLARTFNKNLIYNVGRRIGVESRFFKINLLLGPALNIIKTPRCGRAFEYFSEDPFISGILSKYFIEGLQSQGVGACVKHFACNNTERWRFVGNVIVDERALREIYLRGFEIAIRHANPYSVMTAYNQVNNEFCSENHHLINHILRKEWGFDGVTMTDWGGINSRTDGLIEGLDLEMPGMQPHSINELLQSIYDEKISMEIVDKSIKRLLELSIKTHQSVNVCNFDESHAIAHRAGIESAVLLKNHADILPLKETEKILVLGDLFAHPRIQGAGSANINPFNYISNEEAFIRANYLYARGYNILEEEVDESILSDAIGKAKYFDKIVVCLGVNDFEEMESYDRPDLTLPKNQLVLMERLAKLNKKIVVVLYGGMVDLPFLDEIDALLYLGLPGESAGLVLHNLLYGVECPSGRLATSWVPESKIPFNDRFDESPLDLYRESIFVGYRFYASIDERREIFPFGYGLSYAKFKYSDFEYEYFDNNIIISLDVKNISNVRSSYVLQIYSSVKDSALVRPKKELKGFKKVIINPHETKHICIAIHTELLKVFDVETNNFVLEDGDYEFYISNDVYDVINECVVHLDGVKLRNSTIAKEVYSDISKIEEITDDKYFQVCKMQPFKYMPAKPPYTMNVPMCEMRNFPGRMLFKIANYVMGKDLKRANKIKDYNERERKKVGALFILKMLPYNSLRSMSYSTGGKVNAEIAMGALNLINHKFFTAHYYFYKRKGINKKLLKRTERKLAKKPIKK